MLFEVSFVNGKDSGKRIKSKTSLGSVGIQQPINSNQSMERNKNGKSFMSVNKTFKTYFV